MIKTFLTVICFIVFLTDVGAQTRADDGKLFEIPKNIGLVAIGYQPDAPANIEEVQLLTDHQSNFPKVRYLIRNRSDKKIVSISVEFHQISKVRKWVPYGSGWVETTGKRDNKTVVIGPGGTYENMKKILAGVYSQTNEIPEILNASKHDSKLMTFWIGFVSQVIFKDGSEYNMPKIGDDLDDMMLSTQNE